MRSTHSAAQHRWATPGPWGALPAIEANGLHGVCEMAHQQSGGCVRFGTLAGALRTVRRKGTRTVRKFLPHVPQTVQNFAPSELGS